MNFLGLHLSFHILIGRHFMICRKFVVHTMVRPEFVISCVETLGSAVGRKSGEMIMGGECFSVQAYYYRDPFNLQVNQVPYASHDVGFPA